MQIRNFFISMTDDGSSQKEMNDFMRTHKIIHVSHEAFTGSDGFPIMIYELRYVDGAPVVSLEAATAQSKRDRYEKDVEEMKSKLSPQRLAIFENLVSCRKQIAQEDGINMNYQIFSDKELLLISRLIQVSDISIATIKDMTKERAKKYAVRLLDTYKTLFGETLQEHVTRAVKEEKSNSLQFEAGDGN